jgi:predicted MPP superfamily phosphohydrolase
MRRVGLSLAAALLTIVAIGAYGYREATRDPIVRSAYFADPEWPAGSPAVRLVLMADLHVHGPTMTLERLSRIVGEINALHPDVVVLAGDFDTSDSFATKTYGIEEAVRPLASLRAGLGTFAVLGNHDRSDPDAVSGALQAIGVRVLENDAVQLGPLAIAGVHRRIAPALRELRKLDGVKILVAHSPDSFKRLPSRVPLMLAGHTHCGQIVLPVIGAIATGSRHGTQYICGIVRESGKTLIVTAGLGTSRLPIRLGAPPDVWLITIGPPHNALSLQKDRQS